MLVAIGPANATPEKAAVYYEDALARYVHGDTRGAIVQLMNALQQDERMLAPRVLLGEAKAKDGDFEGAEATFDEALKRGVNRSEVVVPLGRVYLALGRPEAVIERISATGLPADLRAEVLPLLLASGQLESARNASVKAVVLAPQDPNAWNAKAAVMHATIDRDGALAAYGRALALDPRHVDARVARAALFVDLKRDVEATTDLDFLAGRLPRRRARRTCVR